MRLKETSQENSKVLFLDMVPHLSDNNNQLRSELHIGDGVHLNKEGNTIWINQLQIKIKEVMARQ